MAKKPTCSEPNCTLQFRTIDLLRKHLANDHGLDHPEKVFTLETQEELLSWVEQYETKTFVNFRAANPYQTKQS